MWLRQNVLILSTLLILFSIASAETIQLGDDENIDCSGSSCEIRAGFVNHEYEFAVDHGAGVVVIKSLTHLDEGGDTEANKWKTKICVNWYSAPPLTPNPVDKCKTKTSVEGTYGEPDEYDYSDFVEYTGGEFPTDGEYKATVQLSYWTWTGSWDHENEEPPTDWGDTDEQDSATADLTMVWGSCIPCQGDGGNGGVINLNAT